MEEGKKLGTEEKLELLKIAVTLSKTDTLREVFTNFKGLKVMVEKEDVQMDNFDKLIY